MELLKTVLISWAKKHQVQRRRAGELTLEEIYTHSRYVCVPSLFLVEFRVFFLQ